MLRWYWEGKKKRSGGVTQRHAIACTVKALLAADLEDV